MWGVRFATRTVRPGPGDRWRAPAGSARPWEGQVIDSPQISRVWGVGAPYGLPNGTWTLPAIRRGDLEQRPPASLPGRCTRSFAIREWRRGRGTPRAVACQTWAVVLATASEPKVGGICISTCWGAELGASLGGLRRCYGPDSQARTCCLNPLKMASVIFWGNPGGCWRVICD